MLYILTRVRWGLFVMNSCAMISLAGGIKLVSASEAGAFTKLGLMQRGSAQFADPITEVKRLCFGCGIRGQFFGYLCSQYSTVCGEVWFGHTASSDILLDNVCGVRYTPYHSNVVSSLHIDSERCAVSMFSCCLGNNNEMSALNK